MQNIHRVRLAWKEERVILSVPIHSGDLDVGQFLANITDMFHVQRKLEKDNKFINAHISGFKLYNNDLVQYAIMNDDIIELIDYKTWISEVIKKEEHKEWLKISEYDLEDQCRKWISVGKFQKHNQLTISIGTNSSTEKLDLFELDELQNFSKNGKVLVFQNGDTQSCSQIFFLVENNVVKEIIASLKTKSDFNPKIMRIKIKVEDGLELVETLTVQTSLDIPEQFDDPIPSPVYKGEKLKDPEFKEQPLSNDQRIEAKGVVMKQNDDPFLCVDTSRSRQQISIEFMLMNNNTLKTSIVDIIGEYKKGDEWIPATLYTGRKDSPYYYTLSNPHDYIITLESRQVIPIAITLLIPIELKQNSLSHQLRFLHSSFEEPLQLRYIITTQDGDKFTLHTTAASKTYDLVTFETCAKNRKGLTKLIYCDDLELRERFHLSFTGDNDEPTLHMCNSYHYVNFEFLQNYIYHAVKANEPVYKIENCTWTNDTYSAEVYVLVNLEKKYIYALKCVLQSSTNYTEEYIPILPKYYK